MMMKFNEVAGQVKHNLEQYNAYKQLPDPQKMLARMK